MGETITSDKQGRRGRKDPEINKVEDSDVVAEIKEEIVPCAFFVNVGPERKEVESLEGIRYMDPSVWQSQKY
jgi:hypothetical protein